MQMLHIKLKELLIYHPEIVFFIYMEDFYIYLNINKTNHN